MFRPTGQRRIFMESTENRLGNLLLQGNGKDYLKSKIGKQGTIMYFAFAVAISVLGIILANQFGYQTTNVGAMGRMLGATPQEVRTEMYYILFWGGIAIAIVLVVDLLVERYCIGKTEISVYENGIKGVAAGPKFGKKLEDTVSLSDFQLEYDRLSSVDVENKAYLLINSFGKVYLIGTGNPNELANVINERLSKIKDSNNAEQ
jgi:hypothetical protein